jgi:hypothetical protein
VATPDEIQAALQHISRLADEVGPPFRRTAMILGDGAIVGPAAAALDRGMAERHRVVQRSFADAFYQVSRLAPARGAAPPRQSAPSSAGRVSGGEERSGDPDKLEVLARELRRTGRELDYAGRTLGRITTRVGLGASHGRPIAEAGVWADSQATDVRRRREELLHFDEGVADALESITGAVATAMAGPPKVGDEAALLARAKSGDKVALAQLIALQKSYDDPKLAGRIAAWWKNLTDDERERLTQGAPGLLGGLDGLPATIRDQANRLFLDTEKQRLTDRLAALKADPKTNEEEIAELTGKLKGITDIEKRLAMGGKNGRPPMFLLGFDTDSIGHAIVSVGNPDTADNVVNFVPGFGTKLSGAGGNIDRALLLWERSQEAAPKESTASMFWLGYDPPQPSPVLQGVMDVSTTNLAQAGATRLDSFMQGLRAARSAPAPAHTTLLGHSYGSLVSGMAAVCYGGPIADDVAFVGSPGVGVEHAQQLGIPDGHVWAGRSPDDLVPLVPPLDAPIRPDKMFDDHSVRYGNDPTSTEFGGERFTVGHETIQHAHSSYWDPDQVSLLNLAHITTGQYEKVKLIKPPVYPPPSPQPQVSPTPVVLRSEGDPSPAPEPSPGR